MANFSICFTYFNLQNNNVSMEIGKSPRIGVPRWRIELTDGWYSINACIDIGMVRSISTGKIREGTKLVMSGAELLNCDQGFYPLEVGVDFYWNRKRKISQLFNFSSPRHQLTCA